MASRSRTMGSMVDRWFVGGVCAVALALAGCDGRASPPAPAPSASAAKGPDADLEAARDAVTRYFEATIARDCAALTRVRAKPTTPEQCQTTFDDAQKRGARFEAIADAKVDARDRSVALVTATVAYSGKSHAVLLRVTHDADAWKVND